MFAKDRQLDDRIIVNVKPDGRLEKQKTGVRTAVHFSENRKFLFQGVEESLEIEGQATTRPMLIVRMWVDRSRPSVEERYPLVVKTVKPGQSRIETNMELRGGVRAVAEGTTVGTYDVFMELVLPGEDGKKVLVRGTFDNEAIPALRKDAAGSRRANPGG